MFKLLIADDEQLEREALRFIISKSIDSIIDIEEAVNGREAIAKVQTSHCNLAHYFKQISLENISLS